MQPRSPKNPFYIFVVAALAVFVLVLALGRDHGGDYTATAVVRPIDESGQASLLPPDELHRRLTRVDNLRQVIRELAETAELSPGFESVGEIQKNLGVSPRTLRPGLYEMDISYVGNNSEGAVAVVNRLCDLFIRHQNDNGQSTQQSEKERDFQKLAEAAEMAAAQLSAARKQLEAYQANGTDGQSDGETIDPTADPTATSSEKSPSDTSDIDVSALTIELEELRQLHTALSTRMAAEHPQVRNLDIEIVRIGEQIAAAQLEATSNATTSKEASSDVTPPVWRLDEPPAQPKLDPRREQLAQAVAEAEQHYLTLSDRRQRAWEERIIRPKTDSWSMDPASNAIRTSRRTSLALLFLSGALAIVVGSGMFLATSDIARTINNATEAEQLLGIPVVGTLQIESRDETTENAGKETLVRSGMLCFEILLGIFLFCMLLSAMLSSDYATQLRSDPLSALADGMNHLFQMVKRPS